MATLDGSLLQRVVTVPIDPSWKEPGVAVLLQDHDTLAIGAAASARL